MKLIKHSVFLISICLLRLDSVVADNYNPESIEESWCCSGYCFLGGDVPTNPFKEFGVCGATEREARNQIPCSPYDQMGVTCSKENRED